MSPREKSWYICGFADGEGSFNLSWRRRNDFIIGWKVAPVFNISQKERAVGYRASGNTEPSGLWNHTIPQG